MSETGEQMKKRRKQLNMSADELAEKLGVSRSTIFRYEKGDIANGMGREFENRHGFYSKDDVKSKHR